jgi:UDP-2-acetamido-2-deoxy-ribo-hexuluronate aminotransferase
MVTVRADRNSVWAQLTVKVENRAQVQHKLKEQGVPTAVHYPIPLNMQPAYHHLCCPDCTPNSEWAAQRVMSLPLSPDLDNKTQDFIIGALKLALEAA